jgi:hypothetical protein
MSTYVEEIEVYEDDYGYEINGQCKDKDGNVFDLTGYTVTVYVSEIGSTTKLFSIAATITDAANGKYKFTVANTHFTTGNKKYFVEAVATKTGVEITFGDAKVIVKKHGART